MKRKILYILVLCLAQPCLKASKDLVPADASVCSTPSTIEELESFLRDRIEGARFPEVGFASFKHPFLAKKCTSRTEELRAKNAAIGAIKSMVKLVYDVFEGEIDRQKQPVMVRGIAVGYAADRESTFRYYHENNHKYFLKYQEMLTQVLIWAKTGSLCSEAERILKEPYGISSDFGFLWVRDNIGVVPMPYNHSEMRRQMIYQSCSPYGWWDDYRQRSVMFFRGRLVESAGVYIRTDGDFAYKFVRENGVSGEFVTSPYTMRVSSNHEMLVFLKSTAVFWEEGSGLSHAFIPLPSTPDEQREFEAVLLEELRNDLAAGGSAAVFAERFLLAYVRSLEWREPDSGEAQAKEADPPVLDQDILNNHINTLYEAQVRKHQEEISRQVSEGTVVGRPQKTPKGGKKKYSTSSFSKTVSETEDKALLTERAAMEEAKAELKAKILNDLKKQGRVKWRTLVRMIIAGLRFPTNGKNLVVDCTGRGSHFGLRLQGAQESVGLTVVRPHGKTDRTVSAGEARSLADQLIDLTFQVLRQQ